jgi:hypothetical protein
MEENYQEYKLIIMPNHVDFAFEVNNLLKEGWVLYGSPFSHLNESDGARLCQALTKPKKLEF